MSMVMKNEKSNKAGVPDVPVAMLEVRWIAKAWPIASTLSHCVVWVIEPNQTAKSHVATSHNEPLLTICTGAVCVWTTKSASTEIIDFQSATNCISFIANGAGAYSTNLPPGDYSVLIISNHRKGGSIAEMLGQISFDSIKIESEKETSSNAKFSIY